MKISISVNDELLQEIDKAAKRLNVNRSVFFTLSAQEKIKNDNIATNLPQITELLQLAMLKKAQNQDTSEIENKLNELGIGKKSDNKTKK